MKSLQMISTIKKQFSLAMMFGRMGLSGSLHCSTQTLQIVLPLPSPSALPPAVGTEVTRKLSTWVVGAFQLTVAEFSVMSEKTISFGEPMAVEERAQEKPRNG